ncbi:hypothetical protein C8R43DRAFT_216554 [Mycena crocata]|nr:hypothetical protein C8R43DRAFT_216554 [Mycena crocata]
MAPSVRVPHPCNANPHPKSKEKPETTCTVRYIKLRADWLSATYPYLTPAVPGHRDDQLHPMVAVPYFEFRGLGAPPGDVGTAGDVYLDTTSGAAALYTKSEVDWTRWGGPAAALLGHPHFVDRRHSRYVWIHPRDGVEWIAQISVGRRKEALRADRLLNESHSNSLQASLELASRIIGGYLNMEKTLASFVAPTEPAEPGRHKRKRMGHSAAVGIDAELADKDFKLSGADFASPAKRARRLHPGDSVSAALQVIRSATPSPSENGMEGDSHIQRLLHEHSALESTGERLLLRQRGLSTLAAKNNQRGIDVLKTLEKEHEKYRNLPSLTEAEFEKIIPALRRSIDAAKTAIRGKQSERAELERQTEERKRMCRERKERQDQIRALCGL